MVETDYAVPPGEFLLDWLDENDLAERQLADDLNVPIELVHDLLDGRESLPSMAEALAAVTGYSAGWWLKLEAQYQADRTRIAQEA